MNKKNSMLCLFVRLAPVIIVSMLVGCIMTVPVFAENQCGGASTSIISCEDDEGGILHIISLVLDIFSIGVGILGVVGIMIAGVQYLTAKDNQEQSRKAKTRIGQVVVGLALYAVAFVATEWLLPGGIINSQSDLQTIGTTTQIKEEEAKREEAIKEAASQSNSGSSGSSGGNYAGSSETSEEKAKKISDTAYKIASGQLSYNRVARENGYYQTMDRKCTHISTCCGSNYNYRTFCSGFTYNVIKYTGVDPNYPMKLTGNQLKYANNSRRWKNVTKEVKGKTSRLKGGDLLIRNGHTLLIVETPSGQLKVAQAAVCNFTPQLNAVYKNGIADYNRGRLSDYQIFRITNY